MTVFLTAHFYKNMLNLPLRFNIYYKLGNCMYNNNAMWCETPKVKLLSNHLAYAKSKTAVIEVPY